MKNITLITTTALLLFGCQTTPSFNPGSDNYVFVLKFYNSTKEVESVCGKGAVGCHRISAGVNYIHSIKSKCVLNHELEHGFYGSFHDNMKATCKVRVE